MFNVEWCKSTTYCFNIVWSKKMNFSCSTVNKIFRRHKFQMILNDYKQLCEFRWSVLVVDEGHRIKNKNCSLKRFYWIFIAVYVFLDFISYCSQLERLQSWYRLLLTGTPLQNNLSELWSLLNFLMPEIFANLEWFESFFDFNALHETGGEMKIIAKKQEEQILTKLHNVSNQLFFL